MHRLIGRDRDLQFRCSRTVERERNDRLAASLSVCGSGMTTQQYPAAPGHVTSLSPAIRWRCTCPRTNAGRSSC